MNPNSYLIVSDGACSRNPGPGGWGLILVTPSGHVTEFGGNESESTNNRMEMMGFYRGLQEIYRVSQHGQNPLDRDAKIIHAISDSKYVLDGASKFVHAWKRNGWKTVAGGDVKNQDIWEKILKGMDLLRGLQFKFEYELVKGHSGHDANERVDQIAVKFCKNESIELYSGPLSEYEVNLEASEPFEPCYLSWVDGKLLRHQTWEACKRATEGKRGAKYKKVVNRTQEKETLGAWGISR